MSTFYLGLSTSGHDPALALVDESGRVAFAEATERYMQDKRAWGISPDHVPHLASALAQVDFEPARDRLVVATSWTITKADLPINLSSALLPERDGLWLSRLQAAAQANAGASLLRLGLCEQMPEVMRFDHHLCHAAMAVYQAPCEDAVCVVMDGEGEVGAVSVFDLRGRSLKRRWRSWGPGSLGAFYAFITAACGFDWREGEEWKVMGLAAYGRVLPGLVATLMDMIVVDRGRLRMADDAVIAKVRAAVVEHSRGSGDPIEQAADLAASGQAAFALLADRVLAACAAEAGEGGDLVLAGGCALNSSYNGTITGRLGFARVFVPSAPADDGNAVGAALLAWAKDRGTEIIPAGDGSPYLGSRVNPRTVEKTVRRAGPLVASDVAGRSAEVVASRLADGKVLGVLRGRAEFGPRALGNRSILADPRTAEMKDRINRQVKGREPYRPFAPVVSEGCVGDWFAAPQPSPFMSFTKRWHQSVADRVPAVVHQDGTGRLQTVGPASNAWLHDLVEHFGNATGVPIILNTSFNIMGKPIVHSCEDALAVLLTSGLDGVLIEDTLIEKTAPSC